MSVALFAMPALAALDTNRIEQIIGLKGRWNPGEGLDAWEKAGNHPEK